MRTTLVVITLLAFLSYSPANTASIVDVTCLSDKEMEQLIASHSVTLSDEHCEMLLQVIDTLDGNTAKPFQELASDLREQRGNVSLQQLFLLQEVDIKDHIDFFRELSKHPDISLRFISLALRTKSCDSSASNELKQLIDDEALPVEQKRILKTWCVGFGLDIVNDSAHDIYDHLQILSDKDLRPKIGDKAPLFEITDIHGNVVTLAQLKGKSVLIHFWATWCEPCMSEIDRVNNHTRYMIDQDNCVVIGVSLDDNEAEFKAAIKKHNLNWIHNFEGKGWGSKLGRLFKVNSVPQDYVIDENGIIISYDYQDLDKAVTDNEASQRADPTVKMPVESGKAQGTAGHP